MNVAKVIRHLLALASRWSPDPSEAAKQRAGGAVSFEGNRRVRRARGLARSQGAALLGQTSGKSMRRTARVTEAARLYRAQYANGR